MGTADSTEAAAAVEARRRIQLNRMVEQGTVAVWSFPALLAIYAVVLPSQWLLEHKTVSLAMMALNVIFLVPRLIVLDNRLRNGRAVQGLWVRSGIAPLP
jgi:hypothetical protein